MKTTSCETSFALLKSIIAEDVDTYEVRSTIILSLSIIEISILSLS